MKKLMLVAAFLGTATFVMAQSAVQKTVTADVKAAARPSQAVSIGQNAKQAAAVINGDDKSVSSRTPKRGTGPAPAPKKDPAKTAAGAVRQ